MGIRSDFDDLGKDIMDYPNDTAAKNKLNEQICKRNSNNHNRGKLHYLYNWITVMTTYLFGTGWHSLPGSMRGCMSIASFERTVMANTRREVHYASDQGMKTHFSTCELDSHTDTCCLGKNFIPLYYTDGEVCDVHAFSPNHTPISNLKIGGGATLWFDPETGADYILVVNQALMFTATLDHTLLNPNQIWMDGHSLCDDPWGQHRSLGIKTTEKENFIKFHTKGTIIYFDSVTPSMEDLSRYPKIELTADENWDPNTVSIAAL